MNEMMNPYMTYSHRNFTLYNEANTATTAIIEYDILPVTINVKTNESESGRKKHILVSKMPDHQ